MKHSHPGPQGAVQAKRWSKQPLDAASCAGQDLFIGLAQARNIDMF